MAKKVDFKSLKRSRQPTLESFFSLANFHNSSSPSPPMSKKVKLLQSDLESESSEDQANCESAIGDPLEEFQNQYKLKPQFLQQMIESETSKFLIKIPLEDGKAPQPFPTNWSVPSTNHQDVNKYFQMPYINEVKWNIVEQSLNELLEKKNRDSQDIELAIQRYHPMYEDGYNGLHAYFEQLESDKSAFFFNDILPKMILLVLDSRKICTKSIPLLTKQKNCSVTMSQHQAACLLANAFFCTIRTKRKRYPSFEFFGLYKKAKGDQFGKLDCLIHYFNRFFQGNLEQYGNVTFERQCIEPKSFDFWKDSTTAISQLKTSSHGTIEKDGKGMLQVDFANKYLGGGVLRSGCVQEEIRFVICPEAIVSCLLTEELDPNECLFITGCEQYSSYSGYARSFKWTGDFQDTTERDDWRRKMTEIVAMDALRIFEYEEQFTEQNLLREVNKAFCGFSKPFSNNLPPVATGNWGCGAFGGDHYLKALIQIMAASEAGRDVCYFTFGNSELESELYDLHSLLRETKKSVGFLWQCVVEFKNHLASEKFKLYNHIKEIIYTE